jgi:hypothetical protein
MTTTTTAATSTVSALTFTQFVREIPDRAMRRVIDARDAIEAEAHVCARTQSWSPNSLRSAWAPELRDVVVAIDALRAAHEAVEEALADSLDADDLVEARAEAFDVLEEAVEAANDEAKRLAGKVAEREAEAGVEKLLREADACGNDADWASERADLAKRGSDGDHGWLLNAEDRTDVPADALVVTGWAQTRVVQSDDGDVVLGSDCSDLEEHEVVGRVLFQITRDDDGSDEPNGRFGTIAEAVEALKSLATAHGVEDGWTAWSVDARWEVVS